MSNILDVAPGDLTYCPGCADVFGSLAGLPKRCNCQRSAHLEKWIGGDISTPFEICWYCQAEIIRSGSKWSTYYCESCRPRIRELNEALESSGRVSLPVGRHSLMHCSWKHARPFTAASTVWEWSRRRLRLAWDAVGGADEDWCAFAAFLRATPPDLDRIVELVQGTRPDAINHALRCAQPRGAEEVDAGYFVSVLGSRGSTVRVTAVAFPWGPLANAGIATGYTDDDRKVVFATRQPALEVVRSALDRGEEAHVRIPLEGRQLLGLAVIFLSLPRDHEHRDEQWASDRERFLREEFGV